MPTAFGVSKGLRKRWMTSGASALHGTRLQSARGQQMRQPAVALFVVVQRPVDAEQVQWVNVHPHPLLLQLGHVHALLLLPPQQQGALGMQGSERVTLHVGDICSVRRSLLPLPRFNVSLLQLQLQTFLLTLHSHRGFPLGMLCSSRMLERYPPSHLPRRSSMASDTTMRNGVRYLCPSFATQRGALTQLRHTTSSTFSEHLCGTT